MPSQGLALRPVRLLDLPALRRMRSLPAVQAHLRHPQPPSWPHQLRWFWRIHHDPTCRVWAVTRFGKLIGQAGFYYRNGTGAEVSVLIVDEEREDFEAEYWVVRNLLPAKAREWGLTSLWAEVLSTAPLLRQYVFPQTKRIWSDGYSTLYRWSV